MNSLNMTQEFEAAQRLQEKKDWTGAIAQYKALSIKGHAGAMMALAFIYLNQLHRGLISELVNKSTDKEIGWAYIRMAANAGHSVAQYNLSMEAFRVGNDKEAYDWACVAVDNPEFTIGSVNAIAILAKLYVEKRGGAEQFVSAQLFGRALRLIYLEWHKRFFPDEPSPPNEYIAGTGFQEEPYSDKPAMTIAEIYFNAFDVNGYRWPIAKPFGALTLP